MSFRCTLLALVPVLALAGCIFVRTPESPATLVSDKEIGIARWGMKLTLVDGLELRQPGDGQALKHIIYDDTNRKPDGQLLTMKMMAEGSSLEVTIVPTEETASAEDKLQEIASASQNFEVLDQGSYPGGGWYFIYSRYVPSHLETDAYGEKRFVASEKQVALWSVIQNGQAHYRCDGEGGLTVLKRVAQFCGTAEPWTPAAR